MDRKRAYIEDGYTQKAQIDNPGYEPFEIVFRVPTGAAACEGLALFEAEDGRVEITEAMLVKRAREACAWAARHLVSWTVAGAPKDKMAPEIVGRLGSSALIFEVFTAILLSNQGGERLKN
jgi:hypothetical protein